jgi:hypothetical protein
LENVRELCRSTLHDNPHRPISRADYQRARFYFENTKTEELAFMRGAGAVRFGFASASEVDADLRTLGLPVSGSKREKWLLLRRHVYERVTRSFLIAWLRQFGFHLFVTQGEQKTEISPDTLPKLVLFNLLGQFVVGDVVCNKNPGLAVSMTPLAHMVIHFQTKGLPLSQAEQQDTFALFPKYCWQRIQSKGTDSSLTQQLRHAIDDRTTRMGVIDYLLEEGVYATMRLTDEYQEIVVSKLGLQNATGEAFEAELRKILLPYLTDHNGAFLRFWLAVHNDYETEVFGFDNMLAHYTNAVLCRHGWTSQGLDPQIPNAASATVSAVLQNAKWRSAGAPDPRPPDVKPGDADLAQACMAVGLPVASEATSQDPRFQASVPRETKKASTRPERVAAVKCLADTLYMNPDAKMMPWVLKRIENVLRMLNIEVDTTASEQKRFDEHKLWIEALLTDEVLRNILNTHSKLHGKIPANATRQQLLQLLADANMERYKIVQILAENAHKGYLCVKSDEELRRKLDMLDVNSDDMSRNQQYYYFMNLLRVYLPDDVVARFLTESDRKQLELDKTPITWSHCYRQYCRMYGSESMVTFAVAFNEKLGSQIIIKTIEQRSAPAFWPECAASKTTQVTDQNKFVIFEVMGGFHLLQRDPDGRINEFIVQSDEAGEQQPKHINTFSGLQHSMTSLVAYFESIGEKVIRIDDVEVTA